MTRAFPRAVVSPTPAAITLPDPDDAHVVGTALAAHAPVIVTYNLADFPSESLGPVGLRAEHPDVLAQEILDAEPAMVAEILQEHARALRRPPTTIHRLLATLELRGLSRFVAAARVELARQE